MSKTVMCRIIPAKTQNSSGANQTSGVAILEIHSVGGAARRFTIAKSQDLKLNFGDTIKCVSGKAAVMINPGTPAGTFLLDPKTCPELEINDETTKILQRGKVSVGEDIGNTTRGTGATTR